MTDQLPSKDQLCGHCQLPIHPSDARRHFGFYVAHADSRCVQLLQMEIERLRHEAAEANQMLNSEWFQRVTYKQQLRKAQDALTGISTCSTCEACRGAALRALGGQS